MKRSKKLRNREYEVERIVDKRISTASGKIEYFVKWHGWPDYSNTWEPVESFDKFPEIIFNYELNRKRDKKYKIFQHKIPKVSGFDKGFTPENICGATMKNGEVCFLIKWKDIRSTQYELVPSKVARYKCPSLVINFYQRHIVWD